MIWGVTRNVTPMSWRSTLTELARLFSTGRPRIRLDCEMIGMLSPTRISACSLSEVRMWGAETMFDVAVAGRDQADHLPSMTAAARGHAGRCRWRRTPELIAREAAR